MIRDAMPGDAPQVAALWNWMITDTLLTFTTVKKTVDDIEEMIAARGGQFLVSESAGRVVGFATFGAFRSGPGYMRTAEHSVIVAQSHARQGIGAALMKALLDRAHRSSVHVMVAAISSANPKAVDFHARLGFVEVGRMAEVGFKNGRFLDLVLMQKKLA